MVHCLEARIKRVTRTDVEEYAEEEIASSFIVPNEK